jgi:hypothetical protein
MEKLTRKSWFILHDNAPAYWSLVAKKYLAKHNVTVLEHQPYPLDLSQPDFLFPWLNSVLKGQRYANAEEVTAKATRVLTEE